MQCECSMCEAWWLHIQALRSWSGLHYCCNHTLRQTDLLRTHRNYGHWRHSDQYAPSVPLRVSLGLWFTCPLMHVCTLKSHHSPTIYGLFVNCQYKLVDNVCLSSITHDMETNAAIYDFRFKDKRHSKLCLVEWSNSIHSAGKKTHHTYIHERFRLFFHIKYAATNLHGSSSSVSQCLWETYISTTSLV